jgi:acyl-CoA synthetase (AMP-forming)/AMP-acid ligase II
MAHLIRHFFVHPTTLFLTNKFCVLIQGRLNTGDHVALIYAPGVDLIAAFYGCLYVGVVPVTIRPPHPQV